MRFDEIPTLESATRKDVLKTHKEKLSFGLGPKLKLVQ